MSAFRLRRFVPRYSLRTLVLFTLLATSAIAVWHRPYWELERTNGGPPEWAAQPDSSVSPCGKLRVVSDGGKVHVMTANTQERIATLGDLSVAKGEDLAVDWSADGKRLAIAVGSDSEVTMYAEIAEDGKEWRPAERLSESTSGIWDI